MDTELVRPRDEFRYKIASTGPTARLDKYSLRNVGHLKKWLYLNGFLPFLLNVSVLQSAFFDDENPLNSSQHVFCL